MTKDIESAISEAHWKARVRRTEQFIIRYSRRDTGTARYLSTPTLTGMLQKTRVGESPLCILSVTPGGYVRSRAKEFDAHAFNAAHLVKARKPAGGL